MIMNPGNSTIYIKSDVENRSISPVALSVAEVLAIQMAATHVVYSPHTSQNDVLMSHPMSVLHAIEICKDVLISTFAV